MFHLSTIKDETYQTLKTIFSVDIISNQFALAGGTALALQMGHRQSVDLDIFSDTEFDTREIEISLSANPLLNFELVNSNRRMLFSYINHIKCDFVQEPARIIRPFVEQDNVKFFSTEDIAAMKMHTVCGRGKKKDFFDVYALVKVYGWHKMLEWFEEKYGNSQLYFLWRSITYFEDAEEDADVTGLPPFTKNWNEIKEFITTQCR
jgi:predicted nucleotidyltransferase component of viral defense system